MEKSIPLPETLVEAVKYFADEDRAHTFVCGMCWPNGVSCPCCGSVDVNYIATRKRWTCKDCITQKQFSVRVGTIFEDSKLTLGTWMTAIWMVVNAKNGVSSYELHRALGITQKSAWFAGHRIRKALEVGSFDSKLVGEIEADESFIGGKARNIHPGKRKAKASGMVGKAVVMGVLERHGEIRTTVIPGTKRGHVQGEVRKHVEAGATVYTDALKSYAGLDSDYLHKVIDHAEAYVNGRIHTNGLENYWCLFKRCIHGTWIAIEPFHLHRYLGEQTWRFNARKVDDGDRFIKAVSGMENGPLPYKRLIGETSDCGPLNQSVGAGEAEIALVATTATSGLFMNTHLLPKSWLWTSFRL